MKSTPCVFWGGFVVRSGTRVPDHAHVSPRRHASVRGESSLALGPQTSYQSSDHNLALQAYHGQRTVDALIDRLTNGAHLNSLQLIWVYVGIMTCRK